MLKFEKKVRLQKVKIPNMTKYEEFTVTNMISFPTGTARRDVQIPWLSMKNWQQICGIEAQDWWVCGPGILSKLLIKHPG